eukprot:gene9836-11493_t
MSWLFSQALVAEYSAATCSGGESSVQLSVMPTPHKFWRNDRTMEPSQLSRFGLTCVILTEHHGEALLTWFLADSHAKTYRLRGTVMASMEPVLASGVKWLESSVRFDLRSSTWKTHRCLWEEDLHWSLVTLPKWGMTRSGALFQHPTAERPTSEIGLGSLQFFERDVDAQIRSIKGKRSTGSRGFCLRPWPPEPSVGRVADGVAYRMDRLKAIGNGQVPRVAKYSFLDLTRT